MNNGLIKGRIYSSPDKDERFIYRVIAFVDGSNSVLVSDCRSRRTKYLRETDLKDFDEISEEHMIYKTIGSIPSFSSLSKEKQKECRDKYNLIVPLLLNVEKEYVTNKLIEETVKTYKVSRRYILKALNKYLSYGRIETLTSSNNDSKYSLKPNLRVVEYDGREIPGYAILTRIKLIKGFWLYILLDSYSKYIYSFTISSKDNDYNAVKSLVISSNEKNECFPSRLNVSITTETWCRYLRNLQCLGIQVNYGHHKTSMFPFLFNLISKCNTFINKENNDREVTKMLKNEVKLYNETQINGCDSPITLYLDSKPIFKDSFTKNKYSDLMVVLSQPYKVYCR